jgi:hypothetical protein
MRLQCQEWLVPEACRGQAEGQVLLVEFFPDPTAPVSTVDMAYPVLCRKLCASVLE